ncbi:CPBP family intramembrane glutamic endopeptidase [Blastococcus sp. SYSU DS0552]
MGGDPARTPASGALRAVGFGITVHAARLVVILATLALGPLAGISGWYLGLAANVACTVYAVALVTRMRLWRSTGLLRLLPSRLALLSLLPLVAEAALWALPGGITVRAPGLPLWLLTLLLVGVNEELISRGVVLSRLWRDLPVGVAVVVTAALFGAQHLSHLVTGDRALADVAVNVVLSGVYGFALAAFQARFTWLWPLVLVHAATDVTSVLGQEAPTGWYVAAHAGLLAYGILLLRGRPADPVRGRPASGSATVRPGGPG